MKWLKMMTALTGLAVTLGVCSTAQAVALVNPGFDADDASGGDVFGA